MHFTFCRVIWVCLGFLLCFIESFQDQYQAARKIIVFIDYRLKFVKSMRTYFNTILTRKLFVKVGSKNVSNKIVLSPVPYMILLFLNISSFLKFKSKSHKNLTAQYITPSKKFLHMSLFRRFLRSAKSCSSTKMIAKNLILTVQTYFCQNSF